MSGVDRRSNDLTTPMESKMKGLAIASALVLGVALLPTGPAQAAGCIKGALVGGTAGHFMGHHGVLGAMAGCAVGHHRASKHARAVNTNTNTNTAPQSGYGSSTTTQPVPAQR
jgi:hypothetical protein